MMSLSARVLIDDRWWQPWDTAMVVTGALVAMSCALPGLWLVLRRQSMLGDALSHTALPGVVVAFLFLSWMERSGWWSASDRAAWEPLLLAGGAILAGVATAWLTEFVQRFGQLDGGASLGVVFISLFALGLLLIRLFADNLHLDPDCVLFGQLELVIWDTTHLLGAEIPRAIWINGWLLLVNLTLMLLFYQELRMTTFDSEFAGVVGLKVSWIHSAIVSAAAVTVVAAFESVGSILVVALLVAPAATASLWCERLGSMILVTLACAAGAALSGHLLAKLLPGLMFARLGLPAEAEFSTSGMIAVAAGIGFLLTLALAPRQGLLFSWYLRKALADRMAADDLLALLYRLEERSPAADGGSGIESAPQLDWVSDRPWRRAAQQLRKQGWLSPSDLQLTAEGRRRGQGLVRSHRLWETYLHKHFDLPDHHLHQSADRVEHFLDDQLQRQLDEELESPVLDPHGKSIPDRPPSPPNPA